MIQVLRVVRQLVALVETGHALTLLGARGVGDGAGQVIGLEGGKESPVPARAKKDIRVCTAGVFQPVLSSITKASVERAKQATVLVEAGELQMAVACQALDHGLPSFLGFGRARVLTGIINNQDPRLSLLGAG